MRKHIGTGLLTALFMALFFIGQRAHAQTHLVWDSNGNIIASSSEANRLQLSRDITAYNQARIAGAIKSAAVHGGGGGGYAGGYVGNSGCCWDG